MPDISLFQPLVLRGVVEKLQAPESLILLNRLDKSPWPYPTASWDVIKGSRAIAKPNVPNSEAHVVPRMGRSQESASFIYLREKKLFEPTTLHWLRTPGQLAAVNAEAAVLRETGDLSVRFDNFWEFCCWQAVQGEIHLDYPDVQADIDYKFPTTHRTTVGVPWASATPAQIIADVRTAKRLVLRDGRVPAKEAFATEQTMATVFNAFASTTAAAALLSDRMRDEYYSSGILPGFMGLNWITAESIYEDPNGTQEMFLPENKIIIANLDDNRPMELLSGPSADDDAPEGFTGRFTKSWKAPDPSNRQILMEEFALPIITRPEQIDVLTVG